MEMSCDPHGEPGRIVASLQHTCDTHPGPSVAESARDIRQIFRFKGEPAKRVSLETVKSRRDYERVGDKIAGRVANRLPKP